MVFCSDKIVVVDVPFSGNFKAEQWELAIKEAVDAQVAKILTSGSNDTDGYLTIINVTPIILAEGRIARLLLTVRISTQEPA